MTTKKQTCITDTYGEVLSVEYRGTEIKVTFNPIKDHYLPPESVLDTLDIYIDMMNAARQDIGKEVGIEYTSDGEDNEEDEKNGE